MKPKKDLLILATITIPTILFLLLTVGTGTIDLQRHDTYFILDSFSIAVLIIGPLTFLIFLVLALVRKFKIVSTNFGLMTGLILVSLIVFSIARTQSTFRDQVQNDTKLWALPMNPSTRDRFLDETNKNIFITWCVFGVCITGIGLLGFRTYRLVASGQSAP